MPGSGPGSVAARPAVPGSGSPAAGARPAVPAPAAKPAVQAPRPAAPALPSQPVPSDDNPFALSLDGDLADALGVVEDEDDHSRAAATTHAVEGVDDEREDSNPFALDLAAAGIEATDELDDSDAAKTTFEVDEEPAARPGAENPFALEVPEGLDQLDLSEDNEGGVTHELGEGETDDAAVEEDPYKVTLKEDFAKALDTADAKGATAAQAPSAQMKGAPIVPDAHYEKLQATDASVIVQLRDGRIGKGLAGAFSPMAPSFTLNQLQPGKPPISIKLEDCLTIRFVRAYNGGGSCATTFPAKPAPGPVTPGERVQVQLLDGEKLIGTALAHKDGESFILLPVPGGNVKRAWISAKAIRSKTKLP